MDSAKYNLNNPAVKRIMREMKEMEKEKSPFYYARPLDEDIFEWHFTIRGPKDTPYEGGIYHGRVLLPADYPFKPPNIVLLTPSGRFETNKKICLSISAHHPEYWQPGWSMRTVLVALIGFMPTKGEGAIGAIEFSTEDRQKFAKESVDWTCDRCGVPNCKILPDEGTAEESKRIVKEFEDVKASAPPPPSSPMNNGNVNTPPVSPVQPVTPIKDSPQIKESKQEIKQEPKQEVKQQQQISTPPVTPVEKPSDPIVPQPQPQAPPPVSSTPKPPVPTTTPSQPQIVRQDTQPPQTISTLDYIIRALVVVLFALLLKKFSS